MLLGLECAAIQTYSYALLVSDDDGTVGIAHVVEWLQKLSVRPHSRHCITVSVLR